VIKNGTPQDYATEVRMTTRRILTGTLFVAACACSGTSTLGNGEESGGGLNETSVRELCADLAACDEFPGEAECDSEIRATHARATTEGCTDEWDAALACFVDHPGTCNGAGDPSGGTYVMDPACMELSTALEECMGVLSCSGGGSAGPPGTEISCFVSCGDYAAECHGRAGSPAACTCTEGALAGTTFQIDDCQSDQINTVSRDACQ
jgi:hypothetical protein